MDLKGQKVVRKTLFNKAIWGRLLKWLNLPIVVALVTMFFETCALEKENQSQQVQIDEFYETVQNLEIQIKNIQNDYSVTVDHNNGIVQGGVGNVQRTEIYEKY